MMNERDSKSNTLKAMLMLASLVLLVLLCLIEPLTGLTGARAVISNLPEYGAGKLETYAPLRGAFLRGVMPYAAAAAGLTLLSARLITGLLQNARKVRPAADSQSGASVVEFVLIMPLLLALLLTVLQIALLVQAKFVVNYAAFCAARSAIVTIPGKISSARSRKYEGANEIVTSDPQSPKMEIIRRAAALPCVAVSPIYSKVLLETLTPPPKSGLSALLPVQSVFAASVDGNDVSSQLLKRAPYAYGGENTKVEVSAEGGNQVPDHGLVTVKVTFRYYLAVPFANRLLGTPYSGMWPFNASWYAQITEEYSLINEGEPLFPGDRNIGDADAEEDPY